MISAVSCNTSTLEKTFSVGIDFGSRTGYEIRSRNKPPKRDIEKEPSCVLYNQRYEKVCAGKHALNLYRLSSTGVFVDSVAEVFSQTNMEPSVQQVLKDFFEYVYQSVMLEGKTMYGREFELGVIQWVMAVPLYYTHVEKAMIRQACFESGMIDYPSSTQLILLHDAEAVVIYHQPRLETTPQIVTVCDFGSRQTTLSTYKVSKMGMIPFGPHGKIKIGSESLDSIILESLHNMYGEQMTEWCKQMPKLIPRIIEKVKDLKQHYHIGISIPKLKISGREVELCDRETMEQWFHEFQTIVYALEKYLHRIQGLSNDQKVTFVISGGFGRSNHLIHTIQTHLKVNIIDTQPHLATVKGAALLGLDQTKIRNRVFQYSYGTQFSKLFDPKLDNPKAYRWGSPPNEYIACYLPFTTAGLPISPDQEFEQVVCPANDTQTEFPFGLYYSLSQSSNIEEAKELITIRVTVPKEYRHLGRQNRFKILMKFEITEIKFSVIHLPSSQTFDRIVVL